MKRLLVLFAIMALLFAPAMVSAHPAGHSLPLSAQEQEAWRLDGSNWVTMYVFDGTGQLVPSPEAMARAWTSEAILNQSCNKELWPMNVAVHASVAQWISWSITGTRWDWRVRKPGTYATDCISFTVASNNSVGVDYSGFEDLAYEGTVVPDTLGSIATYYAWGTTGQGTPPTTGWVSATNLNNDDDVIPNSALLHEGRTFKLWNQIVVEPCNSSCEYHDDAMITLSLTNMKAWIDPVTGFFKEDQAGNPPHPTPGP